jgi:hypothetical protein
MKNHRKDGIMKNFVLLFAILIVCLPFQVGAVDEQDFKFNTTQDLYDLCSMDPTSSDYAPAVYACRGFIEAAVQYHDAVSDNENLKRLICYGPDATIEDGRKAFVQWVDGHKTDKKLMEELPVIGLVRALADKYPCSE